LLLIRTVIQIGEVLHKEHQLLLKTKRIALLLRKYVAQGYLLRQAAAHDFSRSRQYTYTGTNKKHKIKSKDEVAVIERTNVLNR
jgi:hypothetical protein